MDETTDTGRTRPLPPLRIAMVAGEASGDQLGAGLIHALREQLAGRRELMVEGIGGPEMQAAGCRSLYPMEALSVMGLVEVLRHLPGLLRLRRRLARQLLAEPPDVFVGIDAPDFNLGLERRLHRQGIRTLHYVSPSVWAWRGYRIKRIVRSLDRMLTLFPFEAEFYRRHAVPVTFVGHPLAERIPLLPDATAARQQLGLPERGPLVAVLPGSRLGEVQRLAQPFIETLQWCLERDRGLHFIVPCASPRTRELFESILARSAADLPLTLLDGRARTAMTAADAVLLASGTAALEAMLLKRPMVVAYRLAPATHWMMKRLVRVPHYSLPNLLAGEALVPEYIQDEVTPVNLGQALLNQLHNPARRSLLTRRFRELHTELQHNADQAAAAAVLEVAGHA
ncbi:lipid-A-disaccharide synthase [Thiohalobacter thiocyanaticus]|uniref:Lipid-A-disaccharide synthase n=1 Tax=Thiohalobacter thiocyanaticus TaxID=585455 RepID=A0A1Z4VS40_9GAMM|nr:lipid-A-disaccharide synthase [Thiohalobacter thiocyanaticus]BAZ94447.1 lipid-A-disaccharide synthase [Thiohalobacter thiocyanaticus]